MAENVSRRRISEFVIVGFDKYEKPMIHGIVILSVYLLVILGNLTNICFIVMDKRLHQPMYLFICNLAIVDMLYCTCSCPTMIGNLLSGVKTISYVPCIIQMFFFGLGFVMEAFTITVMAFDRLIAIIKPLRYHSILTNVRCVILNFLLWILGSATISVVPATVLSLPLCYTTLAFLFCDYGSLIRASCVDPNPYFDMMASFTFFLLFGTFSFICGSYVMIVIVVVKMNSKGSKRKVFNTCFSHLIVVVCCYGPTFIINILTRAGMVLTLEERNGFRIGTILGPSLVNPFIYSFRTKEIRNKILRIFFKVGPTNE
ncbi:hypothetical protein Q7C36_016764 [Tachysurus vachellii]|uniref:G-protein coupled receptors family 1 profile domain-containing protein n=1 Tax=Tachysurus vachellii TaxID=175792 RepID=A0AA88MA39_TACVA|nr:olfactory receptor 11H6-like [Tachysurus vachellii]KAK2831678.1 hypothetical protein Q7C36_016764 [Tachysurus vachellii]